MMTGNYTKNAADCIAKLFGSSAHSGSIAKETGKVSAFTLMVYSKLCAGRNIDAVVLSGHAVLLSDFLLNQGGHSFSSHQIQLLTCVSLQVTGKVLVGDDLWPCNTVMCKYSGMTLKEFNAFERWFVQAMDWAVTPDAAATEEVRRFLNNESIEEGEQVGKSPLVGM